MRRLRLLAVALAATLMATAATAAPVLERVVMVSRHGVRAPIKSVDALNALTRRGWPTWPVGPGEMTEHGAKALALMGDFLHRAYVDKGVLPAQGCPDPAAVEVWADAKDHRTRESGEILARALAPGCKVVSRFDETGGLDPIFDSGKSGACPVGLFARAKALFGATRDADASFVTPADRQALATLQDILAPGACAKGLGLCLVPGADASTAVKAADIALGATIAEGLYLEYEQDFPAAEVGWGKAGTPETIDAIMPVHEHGIDIVRRTPALAARRGAVLARTIVALLRQTTLPDGAPKLATDAKAIMLAGHDSNLLYLAGIMGLDWRLPDQPSVTAPDTTMAFELWRDPATARQTVKVVVYGQTLAQLRDATPLDAAHPADVVPVVPEVCGTPGDGGCDVATFAAAVDKRLAALCGG